MGRSVGRTLFSFTFFVMGKQIVKSERKTMRLKVDLNFNITDHHYGLALPRKTEKHTRPILLIKASKLSDLFIVHFNNKSV